MKYVLEKEKTVARQIKHHFRNSFISVLITLLYILDSSGTFTINDNGVQGEGRYTIINGVTEIGLKLVIGAVSKQTYSNDGGTASITSLPPNTETSTPLSPNNDPTSSFHPSGGPSLSLPSNRGPNASSTSNTGPMSSFSPNTDGPSMSRPPSNEPSMPLPSSNEAASPTPEVTLTPEG